jgi:Glycosyltransferase family 25 (LPS biosynthesis protein)
MKMQCYVINMLHDTDRMDRIRSILSTFESVSVTRIDAIRGSTLPDSACELLTGSSGMKDHKGTLGCSLSHALAWEAVARAKDPWGVVMEDDSYPQHLDILRNWEMPGQFDLIFCNSRMSYRQDGSATLPLFPAFEFTMQNRTAIGGDGYILSREGAEKLLSFFSEDGFLSHVDLRLAAYSLTREEMESLPPRQHIIKDICDLRRRFSVRKYLNAGVLGTALTVHQKWEPSSRKAEGGT